MGETWGCIYKTGRTRAASLPESPCVHMHEATWHNSPRAASVMDATPSGDEYIRRGGRGGDQNLQPILLLLSLSLSLNQHSKQDPEQCFLMKIRVRTAQECPQPPHLQIRNVAPWRRDRYSSVVPH